MPSEYIGNDVRNIETITFALRSSNLNERHSVVECLLPDFYDEKGQQIDYGILDKRMGFGNFMKADECQTCHMKKECVGHSGHINLEQPLYNPGLINFIKKILQCICKNCSRVLLTENDRIDLYESVKNFDASLQAKKSLQKEIIKRCQKMTTCRFCSSINGKIKHYELIKFVHIKFGNAKKCVNEALLSEQDDFGEQLDKKSEFLLDPNIVKSLFNRIPKDDYPFLLINPEMASPSNLIQENISVPPPCIRPSVKNTFVVGTNEDDISIQLKHVLETNMKIKKLSEIFDFDKLFENWNLMQAHYSLLINGELSKLPYSLKQKKPIKGIIQRLKGKYGRFRNNLSGKRVNFSGRTVISPNPLLKINEVGVPIFMAKILSYPEQVTKHNLERMKMLVRNGTEKFPGAISITRKNGQMKMLAFRNLEGRMKDAEELMMGDIVKRNMVDGDFVLFNRQPSLHKLSIMCHQVRVLPYRTLQFNESVCTPYNADFDGDEMNIHLPQTEEARAEAMVLLQSKNNLITPKNGEMVIGAIQDFITGSFLMTHKDTFLSFAEMLAIIGSLSLTYSRDEICIPMPHIIKPIPLWSGKQLFSLIIRPNSHSPIKINFETKTKMNTKRDDICPEDTIVIIRNSELLCGYVDKSLIGSGTKKGIFYSLFCDYNQDIAAEAMWRLSTWMSSFLSRRGFSIGIGDVTPSSSLLKSKNNLLTNGYTKCDDYIALHADGNLPTDPGCTKDQTLEAKLLKTLSDLRQSAGEACFEALPWTNSPRIMSISGSKGSLINISQMIAMVGQQALNGHRVPDKFINRTLPHSLPFSKTPKVKGFVKNSFYSGLVASEMFFHTMAGREGLVDTAVKTADTGYMQRRLMKSLEDLVCHYDSSIRTISGKILQFTYGGDGLNPELMEGDDCLVNYVRLFKHVQSITGSTGNSSILTNHAIKTFIDSEFESEPFKKNANLKIKYDLQEFFGESCSNFPKNQPVTKEHLIRFFTEIYNRKQRAILPGGTAIGALCAQSLGEPTTQMTLKTFHFAGVASMSITQGVPRIQEIINANKNIKTPIITAPLKATSLNEAYESQWQVERSTLESISVDISIRFTSNMEEGSYIHVHLVDDPKLNIDEIVNAIENQITNITFNQIKIINSTNIAVFPSPKMINAAKGTVLIALYKLRSKLIKVNARGIKTVNKAVISEIADKKGNKKFSLLIDGLGLSRVLGISGIEPYSTVSNHIKEMAEVLGVEAARNMIIKEIKSVTTNYGIGIDIRHLELLADLMTSTGDIVGINRVGLSKMKDSTLTLASFERTADCLFEAAFFGQKGSAKGVSESVIIGNPVSVGTTAFGILQKIKRNKFRPPRKTLVQELELYRQKLD